MKGYAAFVDDVKRAVNGSAVVASILEAVFDGKEALVLVILEMIDASYPNMADFIEAARQARASPAGRAQLIKLIRHYRREASFPTDDISLARLYMGWKAGTLEVPLFERVAEWRKRLPS